MSEDRSLETACGYLSDDERWEIEKMIMKHELSSDESEELNERELSPDVSEEQKKRKELLYKIDETSSIYYGSIPVFSEDNTYDEIKNHYENLVKLVKYDHFKKVCEETGMKPRKITSYEIFKTMSQNEIDDEIENLYQRYYILLGLAGLQMLNEKYDIFSCFFSKTAPISNDQKQEEKKDETDK